MTNKKIKLSIDQLKQGAVRAGLPKSSYITETNTDLLEKVIGEHLQVKYGTKLCREYLCDNCGREISSDPFCPFCGEEFHEEVDADDVQNPRPLKPSQPSKSNKNKKAGAVVALADEIAYFIKQVDAVLLPRGYTREERRNYYVYNFQLPKGKSRGRILGIDKTRLRLEFTVDTGVLTESENCTYYDVETARARHCGRVSYVYTGDSTREALSLVKAAAAIGPSQERYAQLRDGGLIKTGLITGLITRHETLDDKPVE